MKRKLIPALLSGVMTLSFVYFGFSNQQNKSNLQNVGNANATEAIVSGVKESQKIALTPVLFLVLYTAENLLGDNQPQQSNMALAGVKEIKLSKLD